MKLFSCYHCGNTIYFENIQCERCGHRLGYYPSANVLLSLGEEGETWSSPQYEDRTFVYCDNAKHAACNWLIDASPEGEIYCAACRHNETIPNIDDPANLKRWQTIEHAKKRLFYSLLRLNLPLATRQEDPTHGLSFRFLAEGTSDPDPVMTGHDRGVITIALAEADDAEREQRRTAMGEPYRTLLGHFRHEIGHHYWDLLVANTTALNPSRTIFGDESEDYQNALKQYYAQGAPAAWSESHISPYATAHPWEDFAESWAHYLHIVDTVETAAAFGLKFGLISDQTQRHLDPYSEYDFSRVMDNWVPLSSLLNNLNRAMGHPDAYPFVLGPSVMAKLAFIHGLLHPSWDADH
ncbi:putative zinc-binding metallopeptidase [Devosia rhodophyticola]|uniref:Zinc-binding metallopeptidase n=1 Tax=Devosia rhodophyticola TaxID=3026423 RepID=A0ABY7YV91_9HYPH|nr:putative zinc-binding metallopeptidase [Devosia rhodophyticola]WDR04960.1 putative zinc-binding metallopeptidase [Devosia rhodophyticola]